MKKFIKMFFITLTFMILATINVYAAETKEKYVKYKDYSIYTECYNYKSKEKTAIIFIHGLGDDHSGAGFLNDPKNPFMTISYDNLSHGKTSMVTSEEINWNNQLGAINAIIKAYDLKKVYLVGHSIGADIAMMYTNKYPDKVKKVVLLDRAYYNYSDLEKLNFTRDLTKIVGYDPQLQMGRDVFSKYVDMVYDNDITKTWDIKKKVLLVAANPDSIKPDGVNPSVIDMVNAVKQNPESFNLTQQDVAKLPDLTLQNLNDIADLQRAQVDIFTNSNSRFSAIKTTFVHNMQWQVESKDIVRDYVLNFLK
jgi:pimeloyl-ACP methyl ester carboxylesterase